MRYRSLTYQEAAVRWLPNLPNHRQSPYAWWVLITLTMLAVSLHSISLVDTRALSADALYWLKVGLLLSGFATLYEILGIIWGSRAWEAIEPRLTEIFVLTAAGESAVRDRGRRVWHDPAVLCAGTGTAILGWIITSVVLQTVLGNSLPAHLLPLWFAFGCFWCGAAMYHIVAVSWAILDLSKHRFRKFCIDANSLGIGEIGRLALRYFAVYAVAAMLWSACILAPPTGLTHFMLWVLGFLASVLGLTLFLVPQLSIRRALLQRKREALAGLLRTMESKYLVLSGQPAQNGEAKEDQSSAELIELYRFLLALPISPFNAAGLSRFLVTGLLPLLPHLVSFVLRRFLSDSAWPPG